MNPRIIALLCGALLLSCATLQSQNATLTNRYSFTADATDSVGGQHGGISNATVSAGQVILDNPFGLQSSDTSGKYVDLPDNLVTGYTAVTFETWVTPTHDDFTGGAQWNRLWDFGNSDGAVGIPGFMWMRTGNNLNSIRADVVPPGAGNTVNGSMIADMAESHVVFTCDGVRARLYVNGVQVGANDNFPATPAAMGSTTNNWLGRAQFAADPYLIANINEFRIWDGALNPLEVAASYQSGPDAVSVDSGTATNLQVQISTPLAINAGAQAQVFVQSDGLTNTILIGAALGVTFASGNTNIAIVDTNGNVTAVLPGTTDIVASYAGLSATQAVTVIAVPTTIKHRYSFNSDQDVTDSVGGKNGMVVSATGGITYGGGKVMFDGVANNYVDLPAYLIHPTNIQNGAVTIEAWADFGINSLAWTRLFDFGDRNTGSGFGRQYFFFAPNNANSGGQARVAVSNADPGFDGEDGFNVAHVLGQTNAHIVVVYNPNPSRQFLGFYLNGNFVASAVVDIPLSSVNNVFSWLGRSLYTTDAWFNGAIDEFRIYDGELNRFQVAASFQNGTASPGFDVGSFQSFVMQPGGPLGVNQLRQASAVINFTAATNISLIGDANLTLTSSDTNIATITSPGGIITARAVGSTTLTAVFGYFDGSSTVFYTNSAVLSVVQPPAPTLVHRYSFAADATDSVGSADGTLVGGATITGEQVVLNGTDGYVDLPDGTISALAGNTTFEIWLTDNGSGNWGRIFEFGMTDGTVGVAPYIFLARQFDGTFIPQIDWATGDYNSTIALTNGVETHVVVVLNDDEDSSTFYLNGVLAGSDIGMTLSLTNINDVDNWIGRSLFSADPYLNASIDEFRIYSGLFTAARVQANLTAGPNVVGEPPVDLPTLSIALSGGNVTISWPTNGASTYELKSKSTVVGGTWTDAGAKTVVGQNYQVTVPITGDAQFFQLQ